MEIADEAVGEAGVGVFADGDGDAAHGDLANFGTSLFLTFVDQFALALHVR